MLALLWARLRSLPQGVLVIYFGSAASWRPCNVVWPHQGPVPHSRRLYGEPYAQCNKVALGTTRVVLWCYVSDVLYLQLQFEIHRTTQISQKTFDAMKSNFEGFAKDLARRFVANAMSGLRGAKN